MIVIQGYRITESVGGDEKVGFFRVVGQEDDTRYYAKTPYDVYAGREQFDAFRSEYALLRKLEGKGALQPLRLEETGERPVMLFRDDGSLTLEQLMRTTGPSFPLQEKLAVAIALSECIRRLHDSRISFNELTPDRLLIRSDCSSAEVWDLRGCTVEKLPGAGHVAMRRSRRAWPYLSPEQTGRMGIVPDYRSDFYSLGVMLYEWLTNQHPFEVNSSIDYVYHHMATVPVPACERNPSIPRMLSDIVARCMDKSREHRYDSALGLKADLEECLTQLRTSGRMNTFRLGVRDTAGRSGIEDRLLGRQAERDRLAEAVRRVITEGGTYAVWVCGGEGQGKTMLVTDTIRRVLPANGLFVMADSVETADLERPFGLWTDVLDQLAAYLFSLEQGELDVWKARIAEAAAGMESSLPRLAPRLTMLLDSAAAVESAWEDVPKPGDAVHLIWGLLKPFMDQNRPLVLFLDRLERCGPASASVLAELLLDHSDRSVLVIGAYREEELPGTSRIHDLLKLPIGDGEEALPPIRLQSYDEPSIGKLLHQLWPGDIADIGEITGLLLGKTDGISLHLNQLLTQMREEGMVAYDERERVQRCDLARVAAIELPEAIAALRTALIGQMSPREQVLLGTAAFLGRQFRIRDLEEIAGCSKEECMQGLATPAMRLLVRSIDGDLFAFEHEAIRQSAYLSIPVERREELHEEIGWRLADMRGKPGSVPLSELLVHLNRPDARHTAAKRVALAELNLEAGTAAKERMNIREAEPFLKTATGLLKDEWDNCYPLVFKVNKELTQADILLKRYDDAACRAEDLLKRAATDADRVQAYILMLQMEKSRENYDEVLRIGRLALALLGQRYPDKPGITEVLRSWSSMRWRLRGRSVEALGKSAPMKDERVKLAMSVLVYMSQSSFVLHKGEWACAIFRMIELTASHGLVPESGHGFASYALLLDFVFRRYDTAYRWGKVACDVARDQPDIYAHVYSTFSICFLSWRKHEPDFLMKFGNEVRDSVIQTGDLALFNWTSMINWALQIEFSYPLGSIYDSLMANAEYFLLPEADNHIQHAAILADMLVKLTGKKSEQDPFPPVPLHTDVVLDVAADGDNFVRSQNLCVNFYITGYLFGDYQKALQALDQCESMIRSNSNQFFDISSQHYYVVLVLDGLCEAANDAEKENYIGRIKRSLSALKALAKKVPGHHLHKYELAKAVLSRLKGEFSHAEKAYESALEAAHKGGYIHDCAIIAECYAKYGIRRNKPLISRFYMNEAYEYYVKWGALAKSAELERRYGHLLQQGRRGHAETESIDYLAVMKSAQSISGEMRMENLLSMLMDTMLRNAGAEYGALLIQEDKQWSLEVYGTARELKHARTPLEDARGLVPASIISYAIRTGEEIVLHDAAKSSFGRNDEVLHGGLKSVMCLPIRIQNQLIGMLYLENNLAAGVFTQSRRDVLALLGSQCAISITNAKLYESIQFLTNHLEEQVEERTRDLEKSMEANSEALAEMTVYAERTRIAQEIHDIVGHTLTSTILQIEAGKRLISRDAESAESRLGSAQDLVRHSLNEIRNSVHMLREDKYYDIEEALHTLIRETELHAGVVVHTRIAPIGHLSFLHKKVIYHALQEGLTNGLRHGGAKAFSFTLIFEAGQYRFRLADNGVGAKTIEPGFGLKMMRDRVKQLHGKLDIELEPGKGCMLRIDLPSGA
ncbi:histidine kinase [Paenibacillus agaridevorans]|uniref:histidine kinase n=1 Tax=Paenibacillus agaridevorans TaxID=171404 RepID=UPI001BE4204B|nr:histidine kinase [Paenibacillus agaridevorans]